MEGSPEAQSKPRRLLLRGVVKRPVATTMMVLAVSVFGLVSYLKLPRNLLPDISYPTLTVRTEYEGAAPVDVEKLVTRRLEERLSVIGSLVNYWSISRAGMSDIVLEFQWDTPMTFAAQDVREQVDQVQAMLPEGVKRPLILRYDPTLDPILRIALFEDQKDSPDSQGLYELRRLAEEEIRRQLETIPGVAAVRVKGGFEEEWHVELDEDLLKQAGVSAAQVRERVALENVNVAGGLLRDGDRESLVRTIGEITRIDQLERLVVDVKNGQPVRVKHVAKVTPSHKERDVITRVEGVESVELEIYKEATANVVEVAHAVKARLFGGEWEKSLRNGSYEPPKKKADDKAGKSRGGRRRGGRGGPSAILSQKRALAEALHEGGIRTRVLSDQSLFIENSLSEVRDSGLIGGLCAILVLFLFLRRIGPTAIISVTIPISIVATFAPLFMSGVSLNIMSLGGLALGIGMLVDSAIVVLESITRRREEGEGIIDSAVEGTGEVSLAVLASTLTTVAVFLPIVFVEGIAGEFFRDQALAVVFSLVASLLAALFFIPVLASRRARKPGRGRLSSVPFWKINAYPSVRRLLRRVDRSMILFKLPILVVGVLGIAFEVVGRFIAFLSYLLSYGVLYPLAAIATGLSWALRPLLYLFDRAWAGVEKVYELSLRGVLHLRLIVVLVALGLLFWTVQEVQRLGVELVPQVHQGEFTVEKQLPVGTAIQRTDRVARDVEKAVRRGLSDAKLELAGVSSSSGVARDVIAKAGDGPHTLRLHLQLEERSGVGFEELEARAIDAIRARLSELPEARDPVFTRPSIFSTRTALEVQLIGPELSRLAAAASKVEAAMRALPRLRDVQSTWRSGHPELVIIPDRDQLAFYDLNAGDVAALVRDKVQGAVSTRVTRDDRKIDVLIRVPEEAVNEPREILNLRVSPPGRPPIPLSAVARVDQRPGPAEIRRVAGERAIVVSAAVPDFNLSAARAEVEAAVRDLEVEDEASFRGVAVRVGGQSEESARSLRSLGIALLIAIFLVYIVMASQFESLVHPFVILLSVPLAFVGVAFGFRLLEELGLVELKLSVVVLIGAILLIGIVVNNGIVLVDSVNQHRRRGMARDQALLAAGRRRLRPIIMTTATTVLGLLPLAIGLGEGAEIRRPMAITVICGLIASTALTLLVIPVVYSLLSGTGALKDSDFEAEIEVA